MMSAPKILFCLGCTTLAVASAGGRLKGSGKGDEEVAALFQKQHKKKSVKTHTTEHTAHHSKSLADGKKTLFDGVDVDMLEKVKARMSYWRTDEESKDRAEDKNKERYLLFDPDNGGLNNLRIGWEMAGLIAQQSKRRLVLPPPGHVYLIDEGAHTSSIEDFLNLELLKKGTPTDTFCEFVDQNAERFKLPKCTDLLAAGPRTAQKWQGIAERAFKTVSGPTKVECDLSQYTGPEEVIYIRSIGNDDRLFACGQWAHLGEPQMRVDDSKQNLGSWEPPTEAFELLRNHFVWHPDVFDLAGRVVSKLGLFQYVSLHARYGDFQYADSRQSAAKILGGKFFESAEDKSSAVAVPVLMQEGATSKARAALARHRGSMGLSSLTPWISPGTTLYVSTDETSPEYLEPYKEAGVKAVRWLDLLEDGKRGEGPLAEALEETYVGRHRIDPNRLQEITGQIEQVICAFGRVFVGTKLSTFSGYINRMRLYADAPAKKTLLFHTEQDVGDAESKKTQVDKELQSWDAKGGADAFDRTDVGLAMFGDYYPG